MVEQQPNMPNPCKRPLVLRTASKFSARARLLVRLHDRNHRMEAKIHIDRSELGGGPSLPTHGGPRTLRGRPTQLRGSRFMLTHCFLLQGPPQDKRVRDEGCWWWAGLCPRGGPDPPTPCFSLPHRFRKFNILTSSSKTILAGDSPQEGLVCDFQYLVGTPAPTPASPTASGRGQSPSPTVPPTPG